MVATAMHTPAELVDAFRERGLKVTPQRQLLFRLLHGDVSHPTAEALFARASDEMPGISLRTVYQTLTDLVEMGELRHVTIDGGAGRFDPNTRLHQHAACDACGAITDVYVDGVDRLDVDGLDEFTVTSESIVFRGRCARCDHPRDPHEEATSTG